MAQTKITSKTTCVAEAARGFEGQLMGLILTDCPRDRDEMPNIFGKWVKTIRMTTSSSLNHLRSLTLPFEVKGLSVDIVSGISSYLDGDEKPGPFPLVP